MGHLRAKRWLPANQIPARFDCYFAIEEQGRVPLNGPERCAHTRWFPSLGTKEKDLQEFLVSLNKALVGATAFRLSPESKVIYIAKRETITDPRYAMNLKVSIRYKGVPSLLLDELNKVSGKIGRPNFGTIGERQGDLESHIGVDSQDLTVRQVLTDYLPLSKYHRLLWVAETNEDYSRTWVRFKGKAVEHFHIEAMRSREMTPFSRGEVAYYANLHRSEAVAAARAFVETR